MNVAELPVSQPHTFLFGNMNEGDTLELFGWRRDNATAPVVVLYKLPGVTSPVQTQLQASPELENSLEQIGNWALRELHFPRTKRIAAKYVVLMASAAYINRSLIGDPFGGTPH